MQDELWEKLLEANARYQLLQPGERVLVAVSGGQDSVALLHALVALRQRIGVELAVAHLNHGIRGAEADGDEHFVRRLAEQWGLEFYGERADVPALAAGGKMSLEAAARQARYAFLEKTAAEGFDKVALGHTATDRAESVLMNILRGSGLEGLRGMPARRGIFVRPLIAVTRQQTGEYCARHGLAYRQDATNLDAAHLRNKVRLQLLPYLEAEYGPAVTRALVRLAEAAEEEVSWTSSLVEEVLSAAGSKPRRLALAPLQELADGLLQRVWKEALARAGYDVRALGRVHYQALARLVKQGRTGMQVQLPGEWTVQRGYTDIELRGTNAPAAPAPAVERAVRVPGVTEVPELGVTIRTALTAQRPAQLSNSNKLRAVLDADAAGRKLVVRTWRPGDRIRPLGLPGSKKLQDLFTDAKVPKAERHRVPLIAKPTGEVLWVVGHCICDTVRVTPQTKSFMLLNAHAGNEQDR